RPTLRRGDENERDCDSAASAQTAQGCCDVLRVREDRNSGQPRRGARNNDRFARGKSAYKRKPRLKLKNNYYLGHKLMAPCVLIADSDAVNKSSTAEANQDQTTELGEKEDEASDDIVPEAEKMPAESEIPGTKKTTEHNNKPQQDDVCSLPPSPEDDDENSAASSPESQGLSSKRSQETRRKQICSDSDSDTPAIVKKIKLSGIDYEEREHLVNEFVDSASRTGLEEIQKHSEKLQQEINTLNALARAKEHEWNNIIRLKKMKEEMFLRLQRKRQVILLTMGSISKPSSTLDWDLSSDMRLGECTVGTDEIPSSRDHTNLKETATRINSKEQNTVSQFGLQPQLTGGVSVLKSNQNHNGQNPVIGEGRQGPILDVKSIIADYRSRHPETVPRRGRRLKSSLQDTSRPSSADSSRSGAPSHAIPESGGNVNPGGSSGGISFKDVLVQFAKLSQTEQRHEPLPVTTAASKPPPYPEVTLHPVLAPHSPPHQSPSSSLLHGILTKSNNAAQHRGDTSISARPTTFSPTLARLLTAPERLPNVVSTNATSYHGAAAHVSISDLLSTSKVSKLLSYMNVVAVCCKKMKIQCKTPSVSTILDQFIQLPSSNRFLRSIEEEQEDSADRLVIDESGDGDGGRSRGENEDDQGPEIAAEDVPECQGCHQRAAQFVCAGCGNQWYCSRDCQVGIGPYESAVIRQQC
ncbi:hypothetical protein Cfor_09110, partial [Coptotermes formosanus]